MQCNVIQFNSMQCNAMQGKARQGKARQGKARQGKARQGKTAQRNATQRNATQRNATQRNATQRNATQRNATQRNATQRNATQRNATQRNAMQCNTINAIGDRSDGLDMLNCIRWHVLSIGTSPMDVDIPEMTDSRDLNEEHKTELEDTALYQQIKLGTKQSLAKACRLVYTLQRHEVQLRSLKDRRYEIVLSHANDGYPSMVSSLLSFLLSHLYSYRGGRELLY